MRSFRQLQAWIFSTSEQIDARRWGTSKRLTQWEHGWKRKKMEKALARGCIGKRKSSSLSACWKTPPVDVRGTFLPEAVMHQGMARSNVVALLVGRPVPWSRIVRCSALTLVFSYDFLLDKIAFWEPPNLKTSEACDDDTACNMLWATRPQQMFVFFRSSGLERSL